jgi:hypothetical protein
MFFPRSWINIPSIYIDAGVLGRVAEDMMFTDSYIPQPLLGLFHASNIYSWCNPRQTIIENESKKSSLEHILGDGDELLGVFYV